METEVEKARDGVAKAKEQLDQARARLRKALAVEGCRRQAGRKLALTAARAELSRRRRRWSARASAPPRPAPHCRSMPRPARATPSPENVLVMVGDLSSLRVKAEIEERDIGKVRVGQAAIVRSDAFPGKDFEGKVASLAQALGPSRIGQRGPRKPTDVDVLEIMIDLSVSRRCCRACASTST